MNAPGRGVFVTGTDTGVGKTLVACTLARSLRERGLRVGVMKPVETGVGDAGPLDALALREAAGVDDPLERICPARFAQPSAPPVAARAEGRDVDLQAIRQAFTELRQRHEYLIVEGAGGLLVRVAGEVSMADLAQEFELPLLVVARGALGTFNHTHLTLEAARTRELPVAGVVVSQVDGALSSADADNLGALRESLGARWLGEIPPLEPGARPQPGCIDLASLLGR
ncbi:dethiobiotin synthase [Myxococcota bacterium]|nr:dethiobiotin synthase [Myxococcota bacterium]